MGAFNLGTLTAEMTIGTRGVLSAQAIVQNFAKSSTQALNRLNVTLMETNVLLTGMSSKLGQSAQVMSNQVLPVTGNIAKVTKVATSGFANLGDTITRVSMHLRSFGWLATTVFTAPILMAGAALTKLGMEFEFTMAKMTGLANVAKTSIGQVTDELLKMARGTATDPQKLADTMYFVASSGIEGAQALRVTELAAKGAASGMGDAVDVANLLTSALNAFRATGLTATHMMDVLTATIREGKGEPAEMVRSFGSVMLMAAEAGIKVEDLAGSFALLTLTTNSAANSATYLRQLLMTILKPTPGEEDIMSRMKTSSNELQKVFREGGIMAGLMKMRELTKQYSESMAELFPNLRAFLAMTGLTGQNLEFNQSVMKKFNDVAGDFNEHVLTMSKTIKWQWNAAMADAKSSLTILGLEIAQTIIPMLNNFVERIINLAKWFDKLSEAQKRHTLQWAFFLAVIGPASLILATVGNALGTILGWFGGITGTMKGLNGILRSSPLFILPGILIGVVSWLRNQTRAAEDAAKANNILNTSLVKVNGELKKLSELTATDFSSMGQADLLKNNTWYRQMVDYYEKEVIRLYGVAGVSEADYKKAKKIMDEMSLPSSQTGQTAKDRKWAEKTLDVSRFAFRTDWTDQIKRQISLWKPSKN